ncbi:MAG: flagellar basal body-associated FliL family protein [Phycisphaerae bacterium]|nr:flagellar basal body-associated FliL family protein [Phycisphaerae bacterium]
MAEEIKQETQELAQEKKTSAGMLTWIIMLVIIVVCCGSGLLLGKLFATPSQKPAPAAQEQNTQKEQITASAETQSLNPSVSWYYSLDPVIANLDEPGVTRYVRVTLTLEISGEMDEKKTAVIFGEKNPVLINWLTIYLAGLNIDDIRGDKNLKRIQSQILDSFNEKLFEGSSPMIKNILFKEFAIQ